LIAPPIRHTGKDSAKGDSRDIQADGCAYADSEGSRDKQPLHSSALS
jgi:hypothetical protein